MNVSFPQLQVRAGEYQLNQVDAAYKASVHNPLASLAALVVQELGRHLESSKLPR